MAIFVGCGEAGEVVVVDCSDKEVDVGRVMVHEGGG